MKLRRNSMKSPEEHNQPEWEDGSMKLGAGVEMEEDPEERPVAIYGLVAAGKKEATQ